MMTKRNTLKTLTALAVAAAFLPSFAMAQAQNDGSANKPLRVVLVPADGGTEDGTKKDFLPVFNAISKSTTLNFDIKVGQSYSAVIEAMCSGTADIAFFGPASYLQAKARDCAELLALAHRFVGGVAGELGAHAALAFGREHVGADAHELVAFFHEHGGGGLVALADAVDHVEVVVDLALAKEQGGHGLAGDGVGAFDTRCADLAQATVEVGDGGLGVGGDEQGTILRGDRTVAGEPALG